MTLTSPLFLIGLVAVAIPIAVHLFNFRRYKKVYFSNVDRLEQLQSETRRQSNLRQLLILAARILAIVFLCFAFARPTLPSKTGVTRVGSSDVSIYIDNSFSMDNTDGSGTLLEKAKTKAREIVEAFGPGDRFQLLTNDVEGRHFHWLSKDDFLLMLDEVQTSSATLTISSLAQRQFDFLHNGRGTNKMAFIISDFQSSVSDFSDFPNDSLIETTFVPLQSTACNNVYIDSLALNAPVFHKGGSVVADVWVRNEGDENLEKVPVTLFVNGRQRALAAVDLPARGTTTTQMHFTIDESGSLDGRVETTDYPVTFDDRYYFSLNVRDHINMLLVEGAGSNEYLHRLFDSDSSVKLTTMPADRIDFNRIGECDIVMLDELPSIASGMSQTLHTFVSDGGTLVVVAGGKIDERSYNEALSLFAAPRIEGLHKGRVAASTVNFGNVLYSNVFNRGDRRSEEDGMEMPTVTDYLRLVPSGTTLRESIITLANGDDYISVTPCGSGRLYIVVAPLRDAHTDFVRQALFVPTFYNMALYSVPPTPLAISLGQEAPILLQNSYDATGGEVHLRSADGTGYDAVADIRRTGGNCFLLTHGALGDAGNYRVATSDATVSEALSFNYSRLESQMDFLGRDAVAKMIDDYNLDHCSVVRNAEKPLDSYLNEQMDGRSLWRWCLALCLLMLLLETLLVRKII